MIFQDPRAGINPIRRVGDFLTESLRLNRKWTAARARAHAVELLRAVGLDDAERHLRQYPHELSGGMLQRVMIAGALTVEPKLLLCDEPTTALDVTTQAEILHILKRLQAEREMGLLFITHDLDLAAAVCDRVYVMYAGQIVESAPAVEAVRRPGTPLHRGPPGVDARPLRGTSPTGAHQGCPAQPAREAERLLVHVTMCLRARGRVRRRGASVGRRRRRTRGPVPEVRGARSAAGHARDQGRECSMTAPALLEVSGLRKAYRVGDTNVQAVDGLSFTLGPGGSVGLVGESGSGKTTTARMLVGLEIPDAGSILVGGKVLEPRARGREARKARARAVQIVFQDPYLSLDPRIRVRDCIDGVLRLHTDLDRGARARRVAELLDQVGLGPREGEALPRRLSGGQRQRVSIARALAVEPRVLVLDEAVSALDVSVQAQVLNLLDDIRRQTDVGLVFVSHDLAVVRYVCQDVLVMRRGASSSNAPRSTCSPLPSTPTPGCCSPRSRNPAGTSTRSPGSAARRRTRTDGLREHGSVTVARPTRCPCAPPARLRDPARGLGPAGRDRPRCRRRPASSPCRVAAVAPRCGAR